MRQDMYKVIVERPRRGGGFRSETPAPIDLEDSPRQEGLRRRHRSRKCLNENLAPLKRYLAAQVGRPWDKVFSEICAGIDRRNTVQQHIHLHIEDFVALRVRSIDGVLHEDVGRGRWHPLRMYWASEFYVDPKSKLLRLNKDRVMVRREYDEQRRVDLRAAREGRREDRRVIDAQTQLHRIDGVWYRVELAQITDRVVCDRRVDALRRLELHKCPRVNAVKGVSSSLQLYGRADVYACAKRQLNARELRQYHLQNDIA